MKTEKPTLETYGALSDAFDAFNRALFDGRLEPVVFVFSRKPGSLGSFQPGAWQQRKGPGIAAPETRHLAPQITLNPDFLVTHGEMDVLAILVHQQVHQLQHQGGKPSRTVSTYHNAEWAAMAEAIGLEPTATGRAGGPRTGQKMEHLIVPGGRFEKAALALLESGWDFQWEARPEAPPKPEETEDGGAVGEEEPEEPLPSKLAYRCPQCGLRAWAKPQTNLMCGDCLAHLIPQID